MDAAETCMFLRVQYREFGQISAVPSARSSIGQISAVPSAASLEGKRPFALCQHWTDVASSSLSSTSESVASRPSKSVPVGVRHGHHQARKRRLFEETGFRQLPEGCHF